MALKGKPIAIGTTDTTIYTCPASTEASVHGLVFANNTGSSATITLKIYINSLGTTTTVATGITVAANSTYTWPKPIDVNASDYIQAAASTGSAIVCLYSVYEGSAPAVAVGFTPRGTWSSAATYAINDVVAYSGSSYLAMLAGTNQQPDTATTYWMVLASKGATGSGDVTGPSLSVDSELALFSSTTGKVIKRASLSGIVLATSGVASAATANTDYVAPGPAGYKSLVGYATTATAAGTTTLTNASAYNQFFTGTTTQTVVLPDVTTLALGWTYHISNNSTGTLTVNSSGGNLISTILAGTSLQLVCIAITGTTAASWDYELIGFTTPTGSGNVVLATSPTLVTPALGTPSSATLTNATGLPLTTGVTGTLPVANGGTGTTTSTGSGNVVLSTSPTLVTPILGTPTSGTLTSCTGLPLTTGVTGTLPVANGGTGATTLTGIVKGSGTSAFAAATAGTDYVAPGTATTFTAVQGYAPAALTYAASQTWDVSTNPIATLAPTGNVTSFSISNATAGRTYVLKVTQDTTARTIAYTSANFKWAGGSAPTLSTGSGAVDYYIFIASSSTVLHELGRVQNVS